MTAPRISRLISTGLKRCFTLCAVGADLYVVVLLSNLWVNDFCVFVCAVVKCSLDHSDPNLAKEPSSEHQILACMNQP